MDTQEQARLWLKQYQNMDRSNDAIADPSAMAQNATDVIQAQLGRMPFDSDPAGFSKLLHQLAPEHLKK